MLFIKNILITLCILFLVTVQAQEQVHLAFYNVLNFPQAPPSNRLQILSTIVEDMQPDLFMIAELESENGGNDILVQSLQSINADFESDPYFNNTSSGADLQQMLYFNTSKFELLETSIIPTTVRDINRYRLKILTNNEQIIEVYVSHLKASTGEVNEQLRLDMVEEFTTYLENVDPETFIVFPGDLNLYSSQEQAYRELLDSSNAIVLEDPLDTPGDWNSNSSFEDIHTQSTRISNDEFDDFGAGGGLDSRFDFILLSKNFFSPNATLQYIDASYKSYGNNGNCYNNRLDSQECDGIYESEIRALLYQMSDHLPVVANISVNGNYLSLDDVELDTCPWRLARNIVDEAIDIAFAKTETPPTEVSVYDQTGRLVKTEILQTKSSLDISFLADGLYFVTTGNTKWPTLKFIKTH